MNENYEQLVARFVAGETLSSAEYEFLRDMLTSDPSLIQQVNDDRAIDAILRSDSLSDEQFVPQCVKRYRQLDLDLPTQRESSSKDSRSRLPTNNNLSSFRDRQHQRLSDSDIDLDSLTTGVPPTVSPMETSGNESIEKSHNDGAPNGLAPNITSSSRLDSLHVSDSAKTESGNLQSGSDVVEVNQAVGLETESIRRASVKTPAGSRTGWLAAIAAILLALVTAGIWMSQSGTENNNGTANVDVNRGAVEPGQDACLLYTSPSPRDKRQSRMPSSA